MSRSGMSRPGRAGISRAQIAEDMDNLKLKREAARRNRPRERKLWNAGGSVVMALPTHFLGVLGWKAGDDVVVRLEGLRLIIE